MVKTNEARTYGAIANISSLAEFDPTPSCRMYYVYILKNKNTQQLYYGYTNNLERRVKEHDTKKWKLIYYEAYKAESDARKRERRLKYYAQALIALKSRLKESLN